ncbi:unnamed protein product [Albugo candida]|uniref:Uncharacterized protein n=1 Tax=Albugo candida TaxID=65357 RepID=A0A024GSJ4_9STRA|nr:unnamed protein product [Albugo candida]|eukprot:CCI49328.1 unnamed protein product [Albugo candida]
MSDTDLIVSDDVHVCLVRCPLPPKNSSAVHSLPCHIDYDGQAFVNKYFQPQRTEVAEAKNGNEEEIQTAQFRGVELCGERVRLKSMDLTGFVVDDKTTSETQDLLIWDVDSHFDEITLWNVQDELVDESLELQGVLKCWNELSKAIHYRV